METYSSNPDKTVAAFLHLSTFSKYFIPFGNFIFPLIFWTAKKNDPFVDDHGKQAINFQISIFLYFVVLVCLGLAGIVLWGVSFGMNEPLIISEHLVKINDISQAFPLLVFLVVIATLLLGLLILEVVSVIAATMKAKEGLLYKYPLSINFINSTPVEKHQSKNEQFNNTQNQTL
ncbi:DUF4870 domain-containing protein [Gillisia sp. M10.2A]|uniref:DUF4870 domain-containing protein n=1 Tax=Gillisia lutea TaxID=2909668 RepID=A0ABS9EGC7_9FLAO|nr:DUF4870 domain-containing protein [Gillisia lutea]MCF4101848.1 DUF4870 domain-containing protein [Gillisia lutea]